MKLKNIVIALCVAPVFWGCSDELDITQHGVDPKSNYYKTDDEVLTGNAFSYQLWRATSTTNGNWWASMDWAWIECKEGASDNVWSGGGGRGENVDNDDLSEWALDANNPSVQIYYEILYNMIYAANVVLDNTTEGTSSVVDMCRAEALVFRSWANFELVTLYGNAALVDHCLESDEYKVSNATPEQFWAAIENDLTTAINSGNLTEKQSVNDVQWRITKQVAQALLGKAYLWQKKYTEAANMFDEIVKSGKYALYDGEYGDMCHAGAAFNTESMFEINRVPDQSVAQGFTMRYTYFSWRADKLNFGSGEKGNSLDYFQNSGWGICVPTLDLYTQMKEWEGENGYRFQQTIRSLSSYTKDYGITMKPNATMLGDTVWFWKTRFLKSDKEGIASVRAFNSTFMRYAEVLLLDAEAQFRAGNTAKAAEYLNMIRTRAKETPISAPTLRDIKMEKRFELCMEGTRLQDLQRWQAIGDTDDQVASKVLAHKSNANGCEPVVLCDANGKVTMQYTDWYQGGEHGWKAGKHEYWPIPATEISSNPNMKQNPGY